jgi:nucleoside-diphosphate-sugar epimerase
MRCFVTGASGFVGANLVNRLVRDGHEVLVMVRPSSDLWRMEDSKSKVKFVFADLSTISSVKEEICSFKPDVVFHLAWKGGNSRKFLNDDSQILDNLPGSLELVKIAHEAGSSCFIYLGSCVEYGRYQVPVKESDTAEPQNLYGLSKLTTLKLSEELCALYGVRFVAVRLFWAYGPMDDANRMIPSVTEKLIAGERPGLTGGEQLWDFLYINDVIDGLLAIAQSLRAEGIYNLGSGCPISIREVVSMLRDQVDPKLELGFGEVPYAPDQVMHLEADITKLSQATGWRPRTTMADGIQQTVAWHKARGNPWK